MPTIQGKRPSCMIITEGLAGTENQCIGVTEALGLCANVKRISLREPWKTCSPYLAFETSKAFSPSLDLSEFPDLLITSGRKAIAASRYIKKKSDGRTITVHLQDPKVSSKHFDLVAVPAHDTLRGENVIVTKGTPNKITQKKLREAREIFSDFEKIPSPRIAVLIGGSSKAYNMTEDIVRKLALQLNGLQGGLMITCSRRTGEKNRLILENTLNHTPNFFWSGCGDNPYMGLLAWADYILVTADSASMISESCTTGKPVYMIELEGGAKRIKKLQQSLIDGRILRSFSGKLEHYMYEPLNDSQLVAEEIINRFGSRLCL